MAKSNKEKISVKEFTGKERMVEDWRAVLIAILKAANGEMKVVHHKNEHAGGLITGLTVDMELKFEEAMPLNFAEEDMEDIERLRETIENFEAEEAKKKK